MMQKTCLKIDHIPAVLWGEPSPKGIIAVHGNMSHKMDVPIEMLARHTVPKGYEVLSFDLPEHGDRKEEGIPCKIQNSIQELRRVMDYVREKWGSVSIFANSMGAYFCLMAYQKEKLDNAWFLSPVVDMRRIIENMMGWFQVSEDRLKREQEIKTPAGQTLYWDYYCYVKENPIQQWDIPTNILYGGKDDLCEREILLGFVSKFDCKLEIIEDAEHFFHTQDQLRAYQEWLEKSI